MIAKAAQIGMICAALGFMVGVSRAASAGRLARQGLPRLAGRPADAAAAYAATLELDPAGPSRRHLERRLREFAG